MNGDVRQPDDLVVYGVLVFTFGEDVQRFHDYGVNALVKAFRVGYSYAREQCEKEHVMTETEIELFRSE